MKKISIEKKYNKQLNIFLGIYIILCLLFALLFNGFFIKPKAFTDLTSWEIEGTCVNNSGYGTVTQTVRKTSIGNTRAIYYVDDDFSELLGNQISANNSTNLTATCILIRADHRDLNGSITSEVISSSGGGSVPPFRSQSFTLDIGSVLYNYFVDKGVELGKINNRVIWGDYEINGIVDSSPDNIYSANFASEVEYVDNPEDLYKYLIQGDDSVVKNDNPDNPTLPEDDSLPVPQKLGTDIQNDNVGTPPFISGSWENPSALYASFDASDVQVEIQYKPVFQLYKKVFNLKLAKVSSSEWLPVTKTQISNYTLNRYILYNAYSGYPQPFDSQTLHSGSLTEDILNIGNSNGYVNMFNPISARIANGTNWRIRYIVGNKTSLWVVFHVNSVGSLKNEESVSFENASGDSVSADDVNYTNSAQTSTVDKLNVNNFFDSLSSAINGIFNTTNNSFTAQDTEGSKGFYAMFKATFDKFPVFWTFFCLGLIVAILLRILGR